MKQYTFIEAWDGQYHGFKIYELHEDLVKKEDGEDIKYVIENTLEPLETVYLNTEDNELLNHMHKIYQLSRAVLINYVKNRVVS